MTNWLKPRQINISTRLLTFDSDFCPPSFKLTRISEEFKLFLQTLDYLLVFILRCFINKDALSGTCDSTAVIFLSVFCCGWTWIHHSAHYTVYNCWEAEASERIETQSGTQADSHSVNEFISAVLTNSVRCSVLLKTGQKSKLFKIRAKTKFGEFSETLTLWSITWQEITNTVISVDVHQKRFQELIFPAHQTRRSRKRAARRKKSLHLCLLPRFKMFEILK